MNTLMPIGLSAARRLAVTLLSVVLPAPDERTAVGDDLPTADEEHTVTFGLDGTSYEIDLSADGAAALRDDFATWVSHARRTPVSRPTRRTRRPTTRRITRGGDTTAIRAWARAHGHTVSDRGRLPTAARQAYDAAH